MRKQFSLKQVVKLNKPAPASSNPFVYTVQLDSTKKKRALLLIDPQNDFIESWGSLCVPGAMADSERLAAALLARPDSVSQIFTTLDTHQALHIAHPLFWTCAAATRPASFSVISLKDVQDGTWTPALPQFKPWALDYLAQLEKQGRFKLTIWPEHCLVGTKGHAVVDCLASALVEWERAHLAAVKYMFKGNNALTEHYSCFKAEVPRPGDDGGQTGFNLEFVRQLDEYDEIVVAGQALSHCVNFSVRDLASAVSSPGKITLLVDACSPIPGYEDATSSFKQDMEKVGVRFQTIQQVLS